MKRINPQDLNRVIINGVEWKIGSHARRPRKEDYAVYFAARRLEARGLGRFVRELYESKRAHG